MSIHDFYSKFVSAENNALVESLRRLSLLDDPKAMFAGEEELMNDWIVWTDGGGGEALATGHA